MQVRERQENKQLRLRSGDRVLQRSSGKRRTQSQLAGCIPPRALPNKDPPCSGSRKTMGEFATCDDLSADRVPAQSLVYGGTLLSTQQPRYHDLAEFYSQLGSSVALLSARACMPFRAGNDWSNSMQFLLIESASMGKS
ncbi:hypothetical protein CcaCcLH18_11770 [Colletotrichum camelliae]|nr:hypothetical protein CcaCcLH18_11770 [Colletotrichum camelliae]